MQEDTKQLNELVNQQQAVKLLDPLIKACGSAQENHRAIEQELLRNGFGSASTGIAKVLYSAFKEAVGRAKATEFADAPWRLVRNVAISLNNDSRTPKAAAAIIDGLVEYFSTSRPSAELVEILEQDKRASEKHVIQQELEPALKGSRWKAAISLLDRLVTIETDSEEVAALKKVREAAAGKRRSQYIGRAIWVGVAAILALAVFANRDDQSPPAASRRMTSNDFSSIPPPTPKPQIAGDFSEDRPPIGTGLTLSRANVRYCAFQSVRLEALRDSISDDYADAFNRLVNDWNSRCSHNRYFASDRRVVDNDVLVSRSNLQAEGRAIAGNWAQRRP
jgi:hypothetical protein